MSSRANPCLVASCVCLLTASAGAQFTLHSKQRIPIQNPPCTAKTAIEFISPVYSEEVPVYHGGGQPQSWSVILEIALEQLPNQTTAVLERQYVPAPGMQVPLKTDVNGDALIGDPHPALPALTLTMNDGLLVAGTYLPPGTNLASLFEFIGSEIEHGGDQTTMLSMVVMPNVVIVDLDASQTTTLQASINGASDAVLFRHGFDPVYVPCSVQSTPTVSIFAPDWLSTVDSRVMPGDQATPFYVGVEVRIPCWFDPATNPPTPKPFDPIPGPGGVGMLLTGNFTNVAGPGGHPAYPTLDVRFSDNYLDGPTGSMVLGGVITGGTCATIWGATGQNLAFAFEQVGVQAWYGVDGIPTLVPIPGDDQLIYRFSMLANGAIFDTDITPNEMLITATIETECNVYSITNVRVKHRFDVTTPDPQ